MCEDNQLTRIVIVSVKSLDGCRRSTLYNYTINNILDCYTIPAPLPCEVIA